MALPRTAEGSLASNITNVVTCLRSDKTKPRSGDVTSFVILQSRRLTESVKFILKTYGLTLDFVWPCYHGYH